MYPGLGLSRFLAQLRALADKAAVGFLVVLSVLLLILGKADMRLGNYLGETVRDLTVPVLTLLDMPVRAARGVADGIGSLLAVRAKNQRLREENQRLLGWQAKAVRLEFENRALRETLALPAGMPVPPVARARVVGDSSGAFVHALLVDAGSDQGVADGMAAVTGQGLVGRLVDVGRRSARLILLTDLNSRIPVLVGKDGDPAILTGDNGPFPILKFLPLQPRIAVGDEVVTSGRGGLIPPGLMVGRVEAAAPGRVTVRPHVEVARLDFVTVLAFAAVPAP